MQDSTSSYGLWLLVAFNSIIFIAFAFSFTKPKSPRDWRSFTGFSAFIVALFTEMYGFPLTIYFLSGWLQRRYPGIDVLSHDTGHLWHTLFRMPGNPHLDPFHIISNVLIFAGFWLLSSAWSVLYAAQREHRIAVAGPYAYIRHPQYVAFVIIMGAFLLQWPTFLTLLMFPFLVWMYARLAKIEERESLNEFGSEYAHYMETVPAFIPHRPVGAHV
ncbi:MAG: methyltransferase family protein [Candidatus Tyrphobacter sp.]